VAPPWLRGQGFFGFNTAGGRDDTINFMMNGINLNDPNNNQITFQPTIATIQEFKVDNSTFSAEYGRNSGAIVNIATRSGTNQWHGELYEYLRNNDMDARNFGNPKVTQLQASLVKLGLGGADRATQVPGDFAVRQAFHVVQQEDSAIAGRQFPEGTSDGDPINGSGKLHILHRNQIQK